MHGVTCRGCGVTFQTHLNNRAYCSNDCNLLATVTKALGLCPICSTKDTARPLFFLTREDKNEFDRRSAEFMPAHTACRRSDLDEQGRSLDCQCVACREKRGESRQPAAAEDTNPRTRSTGYQRHREAVLLRDNWTCKICGLAIDPEAGPFDDSAPTLDHIERAWVGGSDDVENLRAAHRWCNGAREGNPAWSDDRSIRKAARSRFAGLG